MPTPRVNERVAALHLGHEQLQKETRNLVTALRSPQTRGRWGEMALRTRSKAAGMAEHCDFDEQRSTTTADGLLRPDMIVHLPGGGQVVIDSKVPLDAFLHFTEADDEDERKAFLKKHANQLRTPRGPAGQEGVLEAVRAFTRVRRGLHPRRIAAGGACEADPGLQDHTLGKGIVLATPNTLVAALKTIALSWQQETLAENAREVRQLGAELYERLRTMTGHMESLQRTSPRRVEAYNKAVGSFKSRVLVTARKFPALGVVGMQSGEIDELAPIEKAPRHLQTYQPDLYDDESGQSTIVALPRAAPAPARRSPHRPSRAGGLPSRSPGNTADVLCRGAARPSIRSGRRASWPCCADLVAEPLDDPVAPEVVSVPPGASSAGSRNAWRRTWARRRTGGRCVRRHRLPISRDRW